MIHPGGDYVLLTPGAARRQQDVIPPGVDHVEKLGS